MSEFWATFRFQIKLSNPIINDRLLIVQSKNHSLPQIRYNQDISNINNQLNIIDIVGEEISEIINCRYNQDTDNSLNVVFTSNDNHFFYEDNIKKVYDKVRLVTKSKKSLQNLNIKLKSSLYDFNKIVKNEFTEYIKIATDWQSKELPLELYYNHGINMTSKEVFGIDYIIEHLKEKATSSRAIIPLIKLDQVIESGDNYLPSLDIIQIGFSDESRETINITFYLRALEVNHFLKINICEAYLIINKAKKIMGSIENINLNILAFKAQYMEKFSCFKKSDLDMLHEREINRIVDRKDNQKIIDLLINKFDLSETVMHLDNLLILRDCIDFDDHNFYPTVIVTDLDLLMKKMNQLKDLKAKSSCYETINTFQKDVDADFKKVINHFKEL